MTIRYQIIAKKKAISENLNYIVPFTTATMLGLNHASDGEVPTSQRVCKHFIDFIVSVMARQTLIMGRNCTGTSRAIRSGAVVAVMKIKEHKATLFLLQYFCPEPMHELSHFISLALVRQSSCSSSVIELICPSSAEMKAIHF